MKCKHKRCHSTRVPGSILVHFAEIILLFTMKQYKNTNIVNFVLLRKNTNDRAFLLFEDNAHLTLVSPKYWMNFLLDGKSRSNPDSAGLVRETYRMNKGVSG